MDLARGQDASCKTEEPSRLLRGACALSQRLTTCQNYFRFHFSRYIYDVLYEVGGGGGPRAERERAEARDIAGGLRIRARFVNRIWPADKAIYGERTRRNGSGNGDE